MLRASARAGFIRLMMRAEPSERCLYNDDDKLDIFPTICNPFMHWVHHSCPLFHQLILFPFSLPLSFSFIQMQHLMRIEMKWKYAALRIRDWSELNMCEVRTGGGLNQSHIVLVKTCSLSSSISWVISLHVGRFAKRGPADGNGGSCCSNVMNLIPLAPPLPTHTHTNTHTHYVALTPWWTISSI